LNEVFFTDVVVPATNLVGKLNNGWAMANGSLAHERGMVWLAGVLGLEESVRRLVDDARVALPALPAQERALAADRVVRSSIDAVAARCLGYRGFAKLVRGGAAPEQALMKAYSTESVQRVNLAAADMLGHRALDLGVDDRDTWHRDGPWLERYFRTFGGTISAGSSEIQRNIIAEKVLGLPRG
jgi:alkylation response protein AidB-like acyl-CoA dehydrogenase